MTSITFDLDSTLADTRHRHGLINNDGPTDWVAYSMACPGDDPIEWTVNLWRLFYSRGWALSIVTGRNNRARGLTMDWLTAHGIYPDMLLMADDHHATMDHGEYKAMSVREVAARLGQPVSLHIDDWAPVAPALAKIGVPCLIVTPPQTEGPASHV